MYRDDHYRAAEALVAKAQRRMAETGSDGWTPDSAYDRGNVMAWLAAAQVHATLAAAGPGVEQAVRDHEKRVAQALGATENDQRARQAARPPLPPVRVECARCEGLDDSIDHTEGCRNLDIIRAQRAARAGQVTTCRCTGLPHDLGSPGCSVPGMNRLMGVEETAGTVRPKPGPPVGGQS